MLTLSQESHTVACASYDAPLRLAHIMLKRLIQVMFLRGLTHLSTALSYCRPVYTAYSRSGLVSRFSNLELFPKLFLTLLDHTVHDGLCGRTKSRPFTGDCY